MAGPRRGVTLIELMVAIGVVAVLAAVSLPSLREFLDRQRLVSQVRSIADVVQVARSEAIKRSASGASDQKSVAMTINPGNPWFVGLANGTAACSGSTCVINEGGNAVSHTVTALECSGCTMVSPASQALLVFDLRGLATGATGQLVTLRSPLGRELGVSVSRLGRVSVCSPAGSVQGYPTC